MGSRKLTAEYLAQITKLAKSWGKIVVRRAFGDGGSGLDVDLSQIEDVAVAAAAPGFETVAAAHMKSSA